MSTPADLDPQLSADDDPGQNSAPSDEGKSAGQQVERGVLFPLTAPECRRRFGVSWACRSQLKAWTNLGQLPNVILGTPVIFFCSGSWEESNLLASIPTGFAPTSRGE